MSERVFHYRPRWSAIIWGALFFGAAAAWFCVKALHNDRGLILNGIIRLSPANATIFYWVMSGLGAGFVVAAVLLVGVRLMNPQRIMLTDDSLTLPRSRWSSQEQHILLREIGGVQLTEVYGQRFAYILHPGGKATIAASMLPNDADFDELLQALSGPA
jgi:hypothetical protein